jgi:hypothetical protein
VSGQNLSAHPLSPANVSFSHADTSEASFLSEDIDASAFIQSDAVDDDDAISADVSTTASSPFERTAKAAEDLRQAVNRRSPTQTLTRNPFESMHGTNPFAPVQTTTTTTSSNNDVAIRQAAAAKLAAARAERAVANARAASFERPSSPSPPTTPPPMHSPGVLPPEVNVPLSPAAPAFSPAGIGDVMSPLTALARGHCTPSPPPQQRRPSLHRLSVTGGAPIGAFVPQSKPETQDTSPSPGEKKKSNKSVSYKLWSNAARAVGLKATKKKAAPKQWA